MLTQLWRKLRPQKTNPLTALMFSLLPGLRGKFMDEGIYDSPQAHLTIYKTSMVLTKYSVTGQTSLLVNPHDVAAAHVHAINYGIYQDNKYPQNVQVWINGVNYTSLLGGPWALSAATYEKEVAIGEILKASTLRQNHRVELRCGAGQGEVEVEVDMLLAVQAIALS